MVNRRLSTSGRAVLDVVVNQGPPPPFDPRGAVERFVRLLAEYHVGTVVGDRYAGLTFARDFERHGIGYLVAEATKTQLYEALEPALNGRQIILLDVPEVEQQLLGLVWRGGKIDHPAGEHDDFANAAAGACVLALQAGAASAVAATEPTPEELAAVRAWGREYGFAFDDPNLVHEDTLDDDARYPRSLV